MSTETSRYVSNHVTYTTIFGVTRLVSIVYLPGKAHTVTTTTVSISVSISNQITTATATVTGPTQTASPSVIVLTEGGSEFITVTAAPVTVYLAPSSTSSSFTCRTYATNYLNGGHGKVKRTNKRSIFDVDAPFVLGEMDRKPAPGAVPKP